MYVTRLKRPSCRTKDNSSHPTRKRRQENRGEVQVTFGILLSIAKGIEWVLVVVVVVFQCMVVFRQTENSYKGKLFTHTRTHTHTIIMNQHIRWRSCNQRTPPRVSYANFFLGVAECNVLTTTKAIMKSAKKKEGPFFLFFICFCDK